MPDDLVDYLKKREIKRSLKTSDYREACKLRDFVWLNIQIDLDDARRKMREEGAKKKPAIKLVEMPDSEILGLAFLWLDDAL